MSANSSATMAFQLGGCSKAVPARQRASAALGAMKPPSATSAPESLRSSSSSWAAGACAMKKRASKREG